MKTTLGSKDTSNAKANAGKGVNYDPAKASSFKKDTVEEKMPKHKFDTNSQALGLDKGFKAAKPAQGY